jgi:putative nucleotidyltransferase with HDIG domain
VNGAPVAISSQRVNYELAGQPVTLDTRVDAALTLALAQGSFAVPLLPEVAAQVMKETSREDWNAGTVVELLKRDPAMAANLLRLANSVAFKGASPSVSLQQSVARLGATNVRQLAVVIACETRVFQVPGFEAEVRHLFRHSLTCAFAAREIARSRRANVEEAFLSGLLHDVGWPLMLQVLLDVTKRVGVTVERTSLLATAGRHHAPLASHLANSWQLPERLRGALHQHHDEQFSGPAAESAATLALADALARFGEQDAAITPEVVHAHPALAVLNVYPDAVDALLAKAPTWWAEAA